MAEPEEKIEIKEALIEDSKSNTQAVSIPVPYINSYGAISKALERIKTASTPDRFTQDFLSTKLNLKGGSPKPIIPFLKRTGFLNGDGTPTDLYKEFRNDALRAKAAAKAVKKGYSVLYEINEYAHDLNDKDLEGVIVQATGLSSKSSTVRAILGSFKALRSFAQFEDDDMQGDEQSEPRELEKKTDKNKFDKPPKQPLGLKLGYVINLNLPATSDIAVFDAIFKSLREHILE
ncbi:MAG: DUF5343 domain-containing protein [Candidatus Daviesbacteria bacterium]|nr:DUF5343 domain-containing protein [Candidatus Daviesbacteria bacterium]